MDVYFYGFWAHISEDPGPRDGAQGSGGIRGAHISEDPRAQGQVQGPPWTPKTIKSMISIFCSGFWGP